MNLISPTFIILMHCVFNNNAEITWEISSTVQPPLVGAFIFKWYTIGDNTTATSLFTETNANSSLTVRSNSFLILRCQAPYPVRWFKNGQKLIDQIQLNYSQMQNWYFHEQSTWTHSTRDSDPIHNNDNYSIPTTGHHSSLVFENVTTDMSGIYICTETTSQKDFFTTAVNILIDASPDPTTDSNHPQLLQAGFENVRMPKRSYSNFDANYDAVLPFIYFAPLNVTIKEYFLLPNLEKVLPFQTLQAARLTIETIAPSLRQGNLTFVWHKEDFQFELGSLLPIPTNPLLSPGDYKFMIDKPGAENATYQLHLVKLIFQNFSKELVEDAPDNEYLGDLHAGRIYEIRAYSTVDLSHTDIHVRRHESYRWQMGNPCINVVSARQATTDFGVMGVYRRSVYCIELVLNASEICSIKSQSSWETSILNILTDKSPRWDELGLDKYSVPIEGVVNESVTFNCETSYMSTCLWHKVGWCKFGSPTVCAWRRPIGLILPRGLGNLNFSTFEDALSNDTTLNVTINEFPEPDWLGYFKIDISTLEARHAGVYQCVAIRRWTTRPRMQDIPEELREAQSRYFVPQWRNINLIVRERLPPVFADGKQFATENVRFERKENNVVFLHCPVDGYPKAYVHWNGPVFNFNDNPAKVYTPGNYSCVAKNKFGTNNRTFLVRYYDPPTNVMAIVIPTAVIVVIAATSLGLLLWIRRQNKKVVFRELDKMLKQLAVTVPINADTPLNYQIDILPYNRDYEISRDLFALTKLIGEGEFGKVFKGELAMNGLEDKVPVAIKVPGDPKNPQHYHALVGELKIMSYIRPHINVVGLIGACTSNIEKKALFVLTEFCDCGSLREYLKKHYANFEGCLTGTDEFRIAADRLQAYAYQAANGMEYLAVENIIHRDLALRNLLLTNGDVIKVADFGLSRRHDKIYRKRLQPNVAVPIYWMASESIILGEYTEKSDVWSFGVVLWEIFTCGRMPYADLDLESVQDLISWLHTDNRLPQPRMAPAEMYSLMLSCWEKEPNNRPSFSTCKRRIGLNLEERSPTNYASLLTNLNNAWRNLSPQQQSTARSIDTVDATEVQEAMASTSQAPEPTSVDLTREELKFESLKNLPKLDGAQASEPDPYARHAADSV